MNITLHVEGGFNLLIKHSHIIGVEDGKDYRKVHLASGKIISVTDSYKDLVSLFKTGRTVSEVRDADIHSFISSMIRWCSSNTANKAIKIIEGEGDVARRNSLAKIRSLSSEEGVSVDDLIKEMEGHTYIGGVLTSLGENEEGEKVWALK